MRSNGPCAVRRTTRPSARPSKRPNLISASVPSAPNGCARLPAGMPRGRYVMNARPTSRRNWRPPRCKSAQVQATVEQMKQKVQQQDLTKDLDLTSEAAALCPSCGAHTQGAKFCPECGKPLRPKNECSKCGTKFEAGTKFCPECGNKIV
ncbi:MAG: zinc ribbon domain-containing protein [Acidobacteriia bacterium]|nr:zinc ribbon domain-containing protein [Terriglobia bacterium]